MKARLTELIRGDETVRRHWNEVASEWEQEESTVLFEMVTDLWVTVRGFSYVSMWMEKWKQENKATVQKSKALRKKINSD